MESSGDTVAAVLAIAAAADEVSVASRHSAVGSAASIPAVAGEILALVSPAVAAAGVLFAAASAAVADPGAGFPSG